MRTDVNKINILFVCMGNICRSPTAEGVFVKQIMREGLEDYFSVDSAGTHAYHIGEEPDYRSQQAARDRDIKLNHIRARKVIMGDFEDFDYILAMDADNVSDLVRACPQHHSDKIKYFLEYAPHLDTRDVPDPYYGGSYGFERVLDLVESASVGFIESLKKSGEIK